MSNKLKQQAFLNTQMPINQRSTGGLSGTDAISKKMPADEMSKISDEPIQARIARYYSSI